jgi:hypothetical protein
MNRDQKIVAIGAAAGVVFMILSVSLLQQVLPVPDARTTADRLAYAAEWDALTAVPLLLMIISVGNSRFLSEAIDPMLGRESPRLAINARVVDNTTQQLLLFVISSLALATNLRPDRLSWVGAAAITFVIVRLAFWIGYLIRPVHRAFGFAGTASLNLWLLATAIGQSFY